MAGGADLVEAADGGDVGGVADEVGLLLRLAGDGPRALVVPERGREHRSIPVCEHGRLDLRGDLDEVGKRLRGIHSGQT